MTRPTYSTRPGGYWDTEDIIVTRKVGRDATEIRVRTWADWLGTWHARFSTTDNARVDAHVAKLAISFEITLRDGASAANYLRVAPCYSGTGLPGVRHYVELSS